MAGRRRISWLLALREILRSAENDNLEFMNGHQLEKYAYQEPDLAQRLPHLQLGGDCFGT